MVVQGSYASSTSTVLLQKLINLFKTARQIGSTLILIMYSLFLPQMHTAAEAYYSKQQVSYTLLYRYLFNFIILQSQPNVVVVAQPSLPTVASYGHRYQRSDIGTRAYIFAVYVTVTAFICCLWALPCSIPAIIYAKKASDLCKQHVY